MIYLNNVKSIQSISCQQRGHGTPMSVDFVHWFQLARHSTRPHLCHSKKKSRLAVHDAAGGHLGPVWNKLLGAATKRCFFKCWACDLKPLVMRKLVMFSSVDHLLNWRSAQLVAPSPLYAPVQCCIRSEGNLDVEQKSETPHKQNFASFGPSNFKCGNAHPQNRVWVNAMLYLEHLKGAEKQVETQRNC